MVSLVIEKFCVHIKWKGAGSMAKLNIPVGVSDFAELRSNGYYYVDKSGLIREMLTSSAAKVTLITRPRRFGKTLGMSMLENFFNIRKTVKNYLRIWKFQETENCVING